MKWVITKRSIPPSGLILGIHSDGHYALPLFPVCGSGQFCGGAGRDRGLISPGPAGFWSTLFSHFHASGLVTNSLSRRYEFQADQFARENHSADKLISSLKKLSKNNLSNLTPHPVYVFFHYSHPPLLQRIKSLQN